MSLPNPLLKLKLASHYAHSGCGYMAQANNFISMMSNMENGEEIFKNRTKLLNVYGRANLNTFAGKTTVQIFIDDYELVEDEHKYDF